MGLVAPAHFLGLLREALPEAMRELVTEEIHNDLVHETAEQLQARLASLLCCQAWHSPRSERARAHPHFPQRATLR